MSIPEFWAVIDGYDRRLQREAQIIAIGTGMGRVGEIPPGPDDNQQRDEGHDSFLKD